MKINVERMRYKNDSTSFWFAILGLVFDIIQFSIIYSNSYLQSLTGKAGFKYWTIGLDVVINILFMLAVFYMAEELKTYHRKWNICAVFLAVFQIVRIFFFPKSMHTNEFITDKQFNIVVICLVASSACFIITTIVSMVKSTMLANFLKKVENK